MTKTTRRLALDNVSSQRCSRGAVQQINYNLNFQEAYRVPAYHMQKV